MSKITASRLEIVAACSAARDLPWTADTSEKAERGTAIHAYLKRALEGDPAGALDVAPPALRDMLRAIDIDGLRPLLGEHPRYEVALAYDVAKDTARVIGEDLGREYETHEALSTTEVPGTGDALGAGEGFPIVTEFKSSTWEGYQPNSWQLRMLALARAREQGTSGALTQVIVFDESGKWFTRGPVEWDAMALDGIAGELRHVMTRPAEYKTGPHCKFCPAFARCAEQAALAQALVPVADRLPDLGPEDVGRLLAKLDAYDSAAEKMRKALEERVRQLGSVPAGDGKVYREVSTSRRFLDGKVALAVLRERGMNGEADGVASVSQEALKKALGAAKAAEIVAEVEARGGVRFTQSSSVRAVKE